MLVSLPVLHKDQCSQDRNGSSQLVAMYKQKQHVQQLGSRETLNAPPLSATKNLAGFRRLPPLPDSGVSTTKINQCSKKGLYSPNISWSRPKRGAFPRTQSDARSQFEGQHKFDGSLEQMLMEVEKGWAVYDLNKKKQKKVINNNGAAGHNEEKLPPVWQKIWYKRIG